MILDIKTPRVFLPLLQPARYLGIWGGRSSGKSHFFAELMIERCLIERTSCVCVREVQKSLSSSVKRLLENKIESLGIQDLWESQEAVLKCKNGSEIRFVGMSGSTNESVKSMESIKICWIEEAQSLSQRSIDLLRPTIIAPGSQIWASWNPSSPDDPIDKLLRGPIPPKDAIVVKANYMDNPFQPEVMQLELEYDMIRDPELFAHIWLGEYHTRSEARVFKNWIIEDFERPKGTIFRFGLDFGFARDPTVLVRGSVEGNRFYIDYEAYGIGCEIVDHPDLLRGVLESEDWFITADSARPETISYLKSNGFPKINAAKKGSGSIKDGVEFLKSFDIVVHPRCVEVIKELTMYCYKTDPLTGAILPVYEDKYNHCIAEGSLVTTMRGDIPIEHVVVGDYALTREGYKRVLFSGVTDVNREVLKVSTAYTDLCCTPDHKIWIVGKGMTPAESIQINDIVLVALQHQEHIDIVEHSVTEITFAGIESRVYDLTIEDKHEFFANGILVHNCIDAIRYLLEGIRHMKKKNRSPMLPSFNTSVSGMGY